MMGDALRPDVALLSRFAPIGSLRPDSVRALARKARLATLPAGSQLFKEGDTDRRSLWLVSGAVELSGSDGTLRVVRSASPEARIALSPKLPRMHAARCLESIEYIDLDSELLDMMMTWDQAGGDESQEADETARSAGSDAWMVSLLQTTAFQRIPPSNIQAIERHMERVEARAGDTIIRQGADGDYFYAIISGRCAVAREIPGSPECIKLAELSTGDTFGEEALLAEASRNATVSMLTDGVLMRLSKTDFRELMSEPVQQWVDYKRGQEIVAAGGRWMDVRLPPEYHNASIPGALNMPLYFIRLKLATLDRSQPVVVYCDTGRRSAAAAFILMENGLDAFVLRGGLSSHEVELRRPE